MDAEYDELVFAYKPKPAGSGVFHQSGSSRGRFGRPITAAGRRPTRWTPSLFGLFLSFRFFRGLGRKNHRRRSMQRPINDEYGSLTMRPAYRPLISLAISVPLFRFLFFSKPPSPISRLETETRYAGSLPSIPFNFNVKLKRKPDENQN